MGPPSSLPPRNGPRTALVELRQKAAVRLAERVDFARSKHKPLSLVRAEAKRALEQFLDVEVPHWPKPERDQLIEELLADAMGLGAIEELIRDESIHEFLILAHNQIVVRRGDSWLPSSVQLRDPEQYKLIIAKLAAQGEQTAPGEQPQAAIDVRLKNGFRVTAVRPPEGLDLQPVATFHRVPPAKVVAPPPTIPSKAVTQSPVAGKPDDQDSRSISFASAIRPTAGGSAAGSMSGSMSGLLATRVTDPAERVKVRVTERLVRKLAAAGIYDLGSVPQSEFSAIVGLYVAEVCTAERFAFDEAARDRLTAEILAGMHR